MSATSRARPHVMACEKQSLTLTAVPPVVLTWSGRNIVHQAIIAARGGIVSTGGTYPKVVASEEKTLTLPTVPPIGLRVLRWKWQRKRIIGVCTGYGCCPWKRIIEELLKKWKWVI